MELRKMLSAPAVALLSLLVVPVSALVQEYCSTENTAGTYAGQYNMYQSNGACQTQCQAGYAFGIVQDSQCWCSNYIPDTTVSVSKCNVKCPGYPDEFCGNVTAGLYGYVALQLQPSGVYQAARTTTSASTSSSSSSPSQLQTGTSDSSSTSSSSTSSSSTTAQMSTQVVTVSGAVITQTVTATPYQSAASDSGIYQTQQSQGLSGGAIAGIVIGVLAGLALLGLAAFLLYRRRRQQQENEAAAAAAAAAGTTEKPPPRRNTSVLSRSGLLARADNENPFDDAANNGTTSQRHSLLFGGAPQAAEPVSPLEPTQSGNSRRNSRPMVYDQRLNPSALFASHDNGSRVSMQDGADYSRTLGIANPDPRASWESRVSRG